MGKYLREIRGQTIAKVEGQVRRITSILERSKREGFWFNCLVSGWKYFQA